MVNVAILGLGTIGYGVYDILKKYNKNVIVKKIFDKDFSKKDLVGNIITTNFDDILFDNSITIVIETLGGLDFPYGLIKKCLENNKNVVTANKEVMAKYFKELMEIKEKYNVSLSFEASVGGGVPIIKNLIDVSKTNEITAISGIINGTTNFLLSRLNEGIDFENAMEEARSKGFAERDSSYDLDGLDMVRKISILSMIASNKIVNIDNVYHYSLKNVNLEDINFVKKYGFCLKYMANYNSGFISVEPTLVKNMFKDVNDEYNLISVDASNYTNLKFYGKGAGRYATANAIVNDINDIINNNNNYTFKGKENFEIINDENTYIFYLRVKDISKVDKDIIFINKDNQVLTKNISRNQINFTNVEFYAKAK